MAEVCSRIKISLSRNNYHPSINSLSLEGEGRGEGERNIGFIDGT